MIFPFTEQQIHLLFTTQPFLLMKRIGNDVCFKYGYTALTLIKSTSVSIELFDC